MRNVNFTYNLDCTFAEGVDHRACRRDRKAGKNIDQYYYPKETGIYLSWSFAGKYYKQSIGQSIKPKVWDFALRLPHRKHANYLELSVLLKSILARVEKQYLLMRSSGIELSAEDIRRMVKEVIALPVEESKPKANLFWAAYKDFVAEKTLLTKTSTVVKYKSFEKTLKAFEATKYPLTFERIDDNWYTDFMVFSVSKGRLNNTICKDLTLAKTFMNWSLQRNMHTSTKFKRFKADMAEVGSPIALSLSELSAICNYDPQGRSNHSLARDLFMTGSYTGARISDLQGMKGTDLKVSSDGELSWELYEHKGRKVKSVLIPITPQAKSILEKYLQRDNPGGYVFPKLSPVIVNKCLKEIGKAAGLQTMVTKVNYSGKRRIEVTLPKYRFLTTHVARKTFVTMLCNSDMGDHEIQSMTGHASAKEMKPYKAIDRHRIREKLIKAFEAKS